MFRIIIACLLITLSMAGAATTYDWVKVTSESCEYLDGSCFQNVDVYCEETIDESTEEVNELRCNSESRLDDTPIDCAADDCSTFEWKVETSECTLEAEQAEGEDEGEYAQEELCVRSKTAECVQHNPDSTADVVDDAKCAALNPPDLTPVACKDEEACAVITYEWMTESTACTNAASACARTVTSSCLAKSDGMVAGTTTDLTKCTDSEPATGEVVCDASACETYAANGQYMYGLDHSVGTCALVTDSKKGDRCEAPVTSSCKRYSSTGGFEFVQVSVSVCVEAGNSASSGTQHCAIEDCDVYVYTYTSTLAACATNPTTNTCEQGVTAGCSQTENGGAASSNDISFCENPLNTVTNSAPTAVACDSTACDVVTVAVLSTIGACTLDNSNTCVSTWSYSCIKTTNGAAAIVDIQVCDDNKVSYSDDGSKVCPITECYPDCSPHDITALSGDCVCGVDTTVCNANKFCYTPTDASNPTCADASKYSACPSHEITALSSDCACGSETTKCDSAKWCYDGACQDAGKYSACVEHPITASVADCVCGVETTKCASGNWCREPNPVGCEATSLYAACSPHNTDEITGADCVCGTETTKCDMGKYCYGDSTETCQNDALACVASDLNALSAPCNCGSESCSVGEFCYVGGSACESHSWQTGDWQTCSETCGAGTATRTVTCSGTNESECLGTKPDETRACNLGGCPEDTMVIATNYGGLTTDQFNANVAGFTSGMATTLGVEDSRVTAGTATATRRRLGSSGVSVDWNINVGGLSSSALASVTSNAQSSNFNDNLKTNTESATALTLASSSTQVTLPKRAAKNDDDEEFEEWLIILIVILSICCCCGIAGILFMNKKKNNKEENGFDQEMSEFNEEEKNKTNDSKRVAVEIEVSSVDNNAGHE